MEIILYIRISAVEVRFNSNMYFKELQSKQFKQQIAGSHNSSTPGMNLWPRTASTRTIQRLRSGYCLLKGDVQKANKYVHRESVSVFLLPVSSQELALHELQKGG